MELTNQQLAQINENFYHAIMKVSDEGTAPLTEGQFYKAIDQAEHEATLKAIGRLMNGKCIHKYRRLAACPECRSGIIDNLLSGKMPEVNNG